VMEMSRTEAGAELARRAKQYAKEVRGIAAQVTAEDLRVVAGDDHDLRDAATGFAEEAIYSEDPKVYARHQDQYAASLLAQGKATTLAEAYRMADAAAPGIARRAGAGQAQPAADAERATAAKHYALLVGGRPKTVEELVNKMLNILL